MSTDHRGDTAFAGGQLMAALHLIDGVGVARAVLRTALSQAQRWELVPRNVAALADPPRVPDRQVEALSPDDARAVLAAVAGSRLDALVTLVLYTGLRQGEALGLRWSDVDVDAHLLTVRMSLQRDSTIALTANTCTGVLPALQREASDRLAALLGSPAADHR